jgi:23S rRNA (pseudouridine1915-N3)-methyltransferase
MTKINIYCIAKANDDEFETLYNHFMKMSSKFAKVQLHFIFNKKIAKAQTIGAVEAQLAYTEAFEPFLNGYNVALDVKGEKLDSFKFAQLLQKSVNINFFIGGAFGFQRDFLKNCNLCVTLSDLTMAHKIANVVLLEQIFRGLCINNHHPYHK